jgi:Do/DeqQ family serine protease
MFLIPLIALIIGLSPALPAQEYPGLTRAEVASLENYQTALRKIAQKVLPVVAEVNTVEVVKQNTQMLQSPFDFFFGPRGQQDPQNRRGAQPDQQREFRRSGLGSGVLVKRDGNKVYMLSNNHVVGDASEITVKLHDGRQFSAKVVGADARKDLALVVFETSESVPVALLGDSDKMQVGDWAIAVGNPLGFESTITLGIVSAVGRRPGPEIGASGFTDYIQTDAAINPGNSGGALVNIYGEVIGINTWIASQSGGNVGLGFAIPINNARKTIDDILTKGSVEYGWLGVNSGDISKDTRDSLRLPASGGAFIYDVFRDSPAAEGGLQPGDLVVSIDGQAVTDSNVLVRLVGTLSPNKPYRFELVRFGDRTSITVKTAVRRSETDINKMNSKLWPGLAVAEINDRIRKELNLAADIGKIVVGRVADGSPASSAGLKTGDIIREIGGKKLNNLMDFYRAVNDSGRKEIMFRVFRNGNEFLVGLVK